MDQFGSQAVDWIRVKPGLSLIRCHGLEVLADIVVFEVNAKSWYQVHQDQHVHNAMGESYHRASRNERHVLEAIACIWLAIHLERQASQDHAAATDHAHL